MTKNKIKVMVARGKKVNGVDSIRIQFIDHAKLPRISEEVELTEFSTLSVFCWPEGFADVLWALWKVELAGVTSYPSEQCVLLTFTIGSGKSLAEMSKRNLTLVAQKLKASPYFELSS